MFSNFLNYTSGFHAHRGHAGQQVDDFFLVITEAVGIELLADGGVLGLLFLVLVEYPVERAAVAQFVGPGLGRDAAQGGLRIQRDATGSRVGAQDGFGRQAGGAGFVVGGVGSRQRERRDRLVADVQRHQRFAPGGPVPEVRVEGDARELALEVLGVLLAVHRVVQHGVAVVEDGFFGDLAPGFAPSPAGRGLG